MSLDDDPTGTVISPKEFVIEVTDKRTVRTFSNFSQNLQLET